MPEAVIVDAVRTPIGRAFKGSLVGVRADELAATPLRALMERNPEVDFGQTDDVMMGAASSVGEQAYNIGRNASLVAGIDYHVPACTVNRFCASSLQTLRMAFHAIKAGEGEQYIAAGVEAVSRAGLGAGIPEEAKHPQLDGSEGSAYDVYIPMGLTAENVAARCKVSREAQDEWALTSQMRAVAAQESGHFDREIVAVALPDGGVLTKDDGPRPSTTMEKLAALNPVFDPENGTVTAGNACPLNDGAAAVLVMSAERAQALGLTPRARIIASTVAAIRP
ncbi:MAG: acetyl-CoA C-acetyltransferase, partial [Solirubrobacteraceae bacterium]|nr:acetyl-CoA C-acetyltransferase [Solirubrobacteraceae bacterium]